MRKVNRYKYKMVGFEEKITDAFKPTLFELLSKPKGRKIELPLNKDN